MGPVVVDRVGTWPRGKKPWLPPLLNSIWTFNQISWSLTTVLLHSPVNCPSSKTCPKSMTGQPLWMRSWSFETPCWRGFKSWMRGFKPWMRGFKPWRHGWEPGSVKSYLIPIQWYWGQTHVVILAHTTTLREPRTRPGPWKLQPSFHSCTLWLETPLTDFQPPSVLWMSCQVRSGSILPWWHGVLMSIALCRCRHQSHTEYIGAIRSGISGRVPHSAVNHHRCRHANCVGIL